MHDGRQRTAHGIDRHCRYFAGSSATVRAQCELLAPHGPLPRAMAAKIARRPLRSSSDAGARRARDAPGAWGMSTGLIYPPNVRQTDEIAALARVVRATKVCMPAISATKPRTFLGALRAAIQIAARRACPCTSRTEGGRPGQLGFAAQGGRTHREAGRGMPHGDQYP